MRQWFASHAEASQHLRELGYHPDSGAEWVWRDGPLVATIAIEALPGITSFVAEWSEPLVTPYQRADHG